MQNYLVKPVLAVKILYAQDLEFLEAKVSQEPKICSTKLKPALTQEKGVYSSNRAIRRNHCSINSNGWVAFKIPLLTEINISKRSDHTKASINHAEGDFKRIIWCDSRLYV